jgi:hypothetical protein
MQQRSEVQGSFFTQRRKVSKEKKGIVDLDCSFAALRELCGFA